MANMNACIESNGDLQDFCIDNDLVDTIDLLNPTLVGRKLIGDRNAVDHITYVHCV